MQSVYLWSDWHFCFPVYVPVDELPDWVHRFGKTADGGGVSNSSRLCFCFYSHFCIHALMFCSTIALFFSCLDQFKSLNYTLQIINVTGISMGSGLGSACDTLISQVFYSPYSLNIFKCFLRHHSLLMSLQVIILSVSSLILCCRRMQVVTLSM